MRSEVVYATQFHLSSKFLQMVSDYLWFPVAVPYSSFIFYRVLITNENKNKNTSQLIKINYSPPKKLDDALVKKDGVVWCGVV